jgi:predicted homoserine dehydrogenase-like protein
MGLVAWARQIGLEVLCGGKFCDSEIRFDPAASSLKAGGETVVLDAEAHRCFRDMRDKPAAGFVTARAAILGERSRLGEFDYEELAIMANATGLAPDRPELHHPTLRLAEVPGVLCPVEEGGVLETRGAIDAVVELREPGALGLGGGVFIVVSCANAYAREIVLEKGALPTNALGTASLIYRPYHFCGVEATLSILYAGLLGIATGADEYVPRVDVVARTRRGLAAGEILQLEELDAELQPARPVQAGAPLPLRLALGRPLAVDLPQGAVVTAEAVVPPEESLLWELRAEQDRCFLGSSS